MSAEHLITELKAIGNKEQINGLARFFKTEPGQFYLHEPVLDQDSGQDYEYHIFDHEIDIKDYYGKTIFSGDYEEFDSFCSEKE